MASNWRPSFALLNNPKGPYSSFIEKRIISRRETKSSSCEYFSFALRGKTDLKFNELRLIKSMLIWKTLSIQLQERLLSQNPAYIFLS